jgi:recombinational DNA repair protein RecR
MAYTPELSLCSSRTLRRIAWALGIPMTQAIEEVFQYIPRILDQNKVCSACKDKSKCSECSFSQKPS